MDKEIEEARFLLLDRDKQHKLPVYVDNDGQKHERCHNVDERSCAYPVFALESGLLHLILEELSFRQNVVLLGCALVKLSLKLIDGVNPFNSNDKERIN